MLVRGATGNSYVHTGSLCNYRFYTAAFWYSKIELKHGTRKIKDERELKQVQK
jgi:hypothetical protein